jgi:hypothetical protein
MNDNVIPYPGRSQGAQTQSKEERKAGLAEEQFKRSDATARKVVMRKFETRPLMHKESERLTVACNVWQILAGLEEGPQRISKRDVLNAAGLVHSATDSTKRLYYFAFDASKPMSPEKKAKRVQALTKSINKYVNIVRAVASLSGKDEWELIQKLIDGTLYSPLQKDIDATDIDINVEGWADVETAIQETAARISTKYDLPGFFKLVRDLGIGMDWKGEPSQGQSAWKFEETPLPALVATHRLQLRPSVYLGEVRVCDDIPCTIVLCYEFGDGEKESLLRRRLRKSGLENATVKGIATPVLRASLELLPLGRQNIVTPVLRLTPWTYIASAENFTGFEALGGSVWQMGNVVGEFDGPIEEINECPNDGEGLFAASDGESFVEVDTLVEFKVDLGAAYRDSPHSSCALFRSWILRLDDSARLCLSKPMFTPSYNHKTAQARGNLSLKSRPTDDLRFFPGDTMAALLDQSLFDAPEAARLPSLSDGPEAARLDHLLDKKTGILRRELEESIEKARARRRERLDQLRGK